MLRSLHASILILATTSLLTTTLVGCGSSDEGDSGQNSGTGATSATTGGAGTGGAGSGGTASGIGGDGTAAGGTVAGSGGTVAGTGGDATTGGASGTGGSSETGGASGTGGSSTTTDKFSFFVTSLAALQELSGSQDGFGGDLRYGETGDGAGLRGADKICTAIAEKSMPGSGSKGWKAFLSTTTVNAIDRVGTGPWYDRLGRLVAETKADLLNTRPAGADSAIINDLPNEDGVPNHDPDGTGEVDNHDILTGTNAQGTLYSSTATCKDWTSSNGSTGGKPRVGHSWPRSGGGGGGQGSGANWMSALDEAGCAPGVSLIEMGPPDPSNPTVGSGGGYGGFYCFALTP